MACLRCGVAGHQYAISGGCGTIETSDEYQDGFFNGLQAAQLIRAKMHREALQERREAGLPTRRRGDVG